MNEHSAQIRLNPKVHVSGSRRRKKARALKMALAVGTVVSLLFALMVWLLNRS